MGTLAALLRCLERDDVSEVRLQSDTVAAASRGGTFAPLTKAPLSTPQIEQIIQGTAIVPALAASIEVRGKVDLALGTQHYTVLIQRHEQRLQLRFFRPNQEPDAPLASVKAATPAPSPVPASIPAPVKVTTPAPPVATAAASRPRRRDAQAEAQLTAILTAARQQNASDVHVFADAPIRLRCAAELVAQGELIDATRVEAMLSAVLTDKAAEDLERQGYADLSLDLPEAGRMRVNIGRQATGFKGCFRLISSTVPTLESLGLPTELGEVSHYHQGLAVISGPNGQGKTTTMAAIVDIINSSSPHHIITVEDPVEIIHPVKRSLISQREVGIHTKSFARALKAALREDPDVIVIGELRDRETVEIALSAAETGHLVIATMSTRSAAKTIDRLIDLFPPDLQPQVRATLAGALKIIVSQRLVPSATGKGVVAAAELITGSVPLWNLIRDNKLFQLPSLQQRGRGLGMIKFDTSLLELVQAGRISEEIAMKNAENPAELEKSLQAANKKPEAPAAASPQRRGGMFGAKKES